MIGNRMKDIASAIIGGIWIIFIGYWLAPLVGTKKRLWGKGNLRFEIWFRVALILLAVVLSTQPNLWRPILHGRLIAPTAISLAAGIAICTLGLGIAVWARRRLAANWGPPMTVRENPELVTTGPYSLVRHPIYTGVLIAQLGSALASGNAWLLLFAACLPYLIYSSAREDNLIAKSFPDQYPRYKSRTKMLIPFVW